MIPRITVTRNPDGSVILGLSDFTPPSSSSYSHSHYRDHPRNSGGSGIFDPSTALPQVLVGGEQAILPFHWVSAQAMGETVRKEVGGKLWESWGGEDPVEGQGGRGEEEEKVWRGGKELREDMIRAEMRITMALEAAQEDPKQLLMHYANAVRIHEALGRMSLLRCCAVIEAALMVVGKGKVSSVLDRLRKKARAGAVVGLKNCVAAAEACKVKGNAAAKVGKHELAVRCYLDGLVALWPWTTSVNMSFEQASEAGLVESEQALLLNVANVALAACAAVPLSGPKRHTRDAWQSMVVVTCNAVLLMRYATYGSLTMAFDRLAQLDSRSKGLTGTEGIEQFMAGLFAGKPADRWAHKFCLRGHVCHD